MFKIELEKYKTTGFFTLTLSDSLIDKCNAPSDQSGIYLIYKVKETCEVLVYIGSSGQRNKDGTLKTRKGGLKDRLVNGYHPNRFGQSKRLPRRKAFILQMHAEKINAIRIYWWVTYDNKTNDFPADVEKLIQEKYYSKFGDLPSWHTW